MKLYTGSLLLIMLTQICKSQYYYKDLVVTERTSGQWKLYKDNKVRSVKLTSFEGDGRPSEGFQVDQEMTADLSRITTHIHSSGTPESWIYAYYSPAGHLMKTVDTSDTYRSISEYQYDPEGHLTAITNTSVETDNHLKEVEQHLWQYSEDQHSRRVPSGMLKIRNGTDTTYVRFVTDAKGNITEERAIRNKTDLPAVYYYYDSVGRPTDIVRFNVKAQKLLPDYIFEYHSGEMPASMLVVPEGSNDYQKWIYEYKDGGLKIKESCYNKKRQLLGKVEYQYH
jgi:YD repeat-containing protein